MFNRPTTSIKNRDLESDKTNRMLLPPSRLKTANGYAKNNIADCALLV